MAAIKLDKEEQQKEQAAICGTGELDDGVEKKEESTPEQTPTTLAEPAKASTSKKDSTHSRNGASSIEGTTMQPSMQEKDTCRGNLELDSPFAKKDLSPIADSPTIDFSPLGRAGSVSNSVKYEDSATRLRVNASKERGSARSLHDECNEYNEKDFLGNI